MQSQVFRSSSEFYTTPIPLISREVYGSLAAVVPTAFAQAGALQRFAVSTLP
jgi:hypothetical protein